MTEPMNDPNNPFRDATKSLDELIKKIQESQSAKGDITNNLPNAELQNMFIDLGKAYCHIMAQQAGEMILKWIQQGIALAYHAKTAETLFLDMDNCTDPASAEKFQAKWGIHPDNCGNGNDPSTELLDLASKRAADFGKVSYEQIYKKAFGGLGTIPKTMFTVGDLSSLMRVYARWLDDYMKLDGE